MLWQTGRNEGKKDKGCVVALGGACEESVGVASVRINDLDSKEPDSDPIVEKID